MKNKNLNTKLIQITNDNYHLYQDMISWRTQGYELSEMDRHKPQNAHKQALEEDHFYVYAAECQNRCIGWIHILITPKIGKWQQGHLFVDELWVAPEFRRQGVALQLLTAIETVKEKTGIETVRLITDTDAARKLYEKYGFSLVNTCVFMEKQ